MQLFELSAMTNISAGEREGMKSKYDHFQLPATELKGSHAVSMRLVPVIDEEFLGQSKVSVHDCLCLHPYDRSNHNRIDSIKKRVAQSNA